MPLRQHDIDREIAARAPRTRRPAPAAHRPPHHPSRDYAPYRSSVLRHPKQPPVAVRGDPETVELHTPVFGRTDVTDNDNDLTRQHQGEPLGERITVTGRLLDSAGRPVRGQLIELWQANAAGPLRPPAGPASGAAGPQLHRRRTHPDRRRRRLPLHHDQARRLPVAQPRQRLAAGAHPLLAVRHGVHPAARDADVLPRRPALRLRPHPAVRDRRVRPAAAGRGLRSQAVALGMVAGLPLGHRARRSLRHLDRGRTPMTTPQLPTPSHTVGPFFGFALPFPGGGDVAPAGRTDTVTVHGSVLDGAGEPVPDASRGIAALNRRRAVGSSLATAFAVLAADIHFGGRPRRLPAEPIASRSTTRIASARRSLSARRSASILRISITISHNYHMIDGRQPTLTRCVIHVALATFAQLVGMARVVGGHETDRSCPFG